MELIQVEELLKEVTKRAVRKINQTYKETVEVKKLIAQEKENSKHTVEDSTEVHEKESVEQAVSLKIGDDYWAKVKGDVVWPTRIRPESEKIILKVHFSGYSRSPKILTYSKFIKH